MYKKSFTFINTEINVFLVNVNFFALVISNASSGANLRTSTTPTAPNPQLPPDSGPLGASAIADHQASPQRNGNPTALHLPPPKLTLSLSSLQLRKKPRKNVGKPRLQRQRKSRSRSRSKEKTVTTEDVTKTYTGLDRAIAEEFIEMCDSRNASDSSCTSSSGSSSACRCQHPCAGCVKSSDVEKKKEEEEVAG